jgi:branched-chain amino acid transport system substrate-binding protein
VASQSGPDRTARDVRKRPEARGGGGRVDRRTFLRGAGAAAGAGLVVGGVPAYLIGKGSGDAAASSGAGGRAIKIGASLPLTGPIAAEGDLEKKAIELAIADVNAGGGVAGRKVELVTLDVGDMNAQKMVSNFRALIAKERVDAILGGWHLFTGPEYPIVADAGIPYLHVNTQQANAETELKDPDKYWMTFQCCPTNVWYGRGFPRVVDQLVESGQFEPRNKTIAIVAASDPYGLGIGNEVRTAMEKYGWRVSLFQKVVAPVSEWGPVLARIRRDPPDIIFNTDVSVPDIAAFVKQFASNPTNSLVYGQYGPSQPQFKQLAGRAADGVIWSSMTSLLPDTIGNAYRKHWQDKYSSDPGLSASGFAYDMTMLYLRQVGMAGGPENRREIAERLRADRWRGLNGTYNFSSELRTVTGFPDSTTDPSLGLPHCYLQIQDGEDKFIAPSPFTNAEFKTPPWFS